MAYSFRRDRHGRGVRGPLIGGGSPVAATGRLHRFELGFKEAVERFQEQVDLSATSFRINFVATAAPSPDIEPAGIGGGTSISYGPGPDELTLAVHRAPMLAHSPGPEFLVETIYEALVYRWADLTAQRPEQVDPELFGE